MQTSDYSKLSEKSHTALFALLFFFPIFLLFPSPVPSSANTHTPPGVNEQSDPGDSVISETTTAEQTNQATNLLSPAAFLGNISSQILSEVSLLAEQLFPSPEQDGIYRESKFTPTMTATLVISSLGLLLYGVVLVTAEPIMKRIEENKKNNATNTGKGIGTLESLSRKATNITRIFF